jgi:hypothetical protein
VGSGHRAQGSAYGEPQGRGGGLPAVVCRLSSDGAGARELVGMGRGAAPDSRACRPPEQSRRVPNIASARPRVPPFARNISTTPHPAQDPRCRCPAACSRVPALPTRRVPENLLRRPPLPFLRPPLT